mmetsp:Transcript_12662/g.39972  ORF Transcript_12662/g.39972 Transcript_12662/m.39972 type:complete len:137 (+) Transcript_12662:435-845(+)
MNMCSKCFRDMESQHKVAEAVKAPIEAVNAAVTAEVPVPTPVPAAAPEAEEATGAEVVAAEEAGGEQPREQKNPSRCYTCNKRVGLTGFKCRCSFIYCSSHRYSDKHECSFDYKAAGRDAIAKANPTVVAAKIDKI